MLEGPDHASEHYLLLMYTEEIGIYTLWSQMMHTLHTLFVETELYSLPLDISKMYGERVFVFGFLSVLIMYIWTLNLTYRKLSIHTKTDTEVDMYIMAIMLTMVKTISFINKTSSSTLLIAGPSKKTIKNPRPAACND